MRRRHDVSAQLKEWVDRQGGSASVRVVDLLDVLHLPAWDKKGQQIVAATLDDAELSTDQPLDQLERWYTVRLRSAQRPVLSRRPPVRAFVLEHSGEFEELTDVEAALEDPRLIWIDVGDPDEAQLRALVKRLVGRPVEEQLTNSDCQRITADLARPDARPSVHVFGKNATTRTSSFMEVAHSEGSQFDGDEESKAGHLSVRLVELLAGCTFVATRRFECEVLGGGLRLQLARAATTSRAPQPAPVDLDRLVTQIKRRWRRAAVRAERADRKLGAGDLGMLMVHELSESFEKARRALSTWLDQWELEWLDPNRNVERTTVVAVRSLVDEFHDRLVTLKHPYGGDPAIGWFANVNDEAEAEHVHGLILRTLRELEALQERVRGAFDLLEITVGDRTRRQIEFIGFVLLLPAAIAGIFGANTYVPGQGATWGFLLMLGIMAAGMAGVLLVFSGSWRRWLRRRRASRRSPIK